MDARVEGPRGHLPLRPRRHAHRLVLRPEQEAHRRMHPAERRGCHGQGRRCSGQAANCRRGRPQAPRGKDAPGNLPRHVEGTGRRVHQRDAHRRGPAGHLRAARPNAPHAPRPRLRTAQGRKEGGQRRLLQHRRWRSGRKAEHRPMG